MQHITPYLYYEDVNAAMKWLARAFGFRRFGAKMTGPGGKVRHAMMKLGEAVVMMGWPGPGFKNPKRLGQATQCLLLRVDDADAHFDRAKKARAKILQEPEDMFNRDRRYGATDPEGHEWYFTSTMAKPRSKRG